MTTRLATALLAGLLGAAVPLVASGPAPTADRRPGAGLDTDRIVALHNAAREEAGLPPLGVADQLMSAARAKLFDMLKHEYFAHRTPDGRPPWAFMQAAGYRFQVAAENLAKGYDSETELQRDWMRSKGHRANILNPRFTEMGIADAQGIVVVMFGRPMPPRVGR